MFARADKISLQDYEFQSLEVPKFLKFCGIGKKLEEIFFIWNVQLLYERGKSMFRFGCFSGFVSKTSVNETDGNNEWFCLCLCEC